jgi:hypothetical protein
MKDDSSAWSIPTRLAVVFSGGIALSLVPGVPGAVGAILAGIPLVVIAWKVLGRG